MQACTEWTLPKWKAQPPVSLSRNAYEWGLFGNLFVLQQFVFHLLILAEWVQLTGWSANINSAGNFASVWFLGFKKLFHVSSQVVAEKQSHSGHHNEETQAWTDLAASLASGSVGRMQKVKAKGHW